MIMMTSDDHDSVDYDKEQLSKWYSIRQIFLNSINSIRQIHTLSFNKPTVRVTSAFLGLAETSASSGRSPMTITLVRSYCKPRNK